MNDGTIAIVVVNAATISLVPTNAADVIGVDGQAAVLARTTLADVYGHPANIMTLEVAPNAVIEVSAIYQPPSPQLVNPRFTYDLTGRLTLVDYDGGYQKSLNYAHDRLLSIDLFDGRLTRRKSFAYDPAGVLVRISES